MLRHCLMEAERRTQRMYLPKYHQWRCAEGSELISTLCRPWHLMWVTGLFHKPVAYLRGGWVAEERILALLELEPRTAWRTPGHMNEKSRLTKYGSTIIVRNITFLRISIILQISGRAQLSIIEEVSHKCLNVGHKSEFLHKVFCGFTQPSLA
jgi:hypothetical protein